jgi:membrane-bound metal-dependent hydrolase YbcI (DUF457 family)
LRVLLDFRLRSRSTQVLQWPPGVDRAVFQYAVARMPSPFGHAVAAIAAGCLVPEEQAQRRLSVRDLMLFGALGVAPDLDLLFAIHSGPTHGIGAAVLVAAAAYLASRRDRASTERLRFAVACFLAYASHILLDWLGTDSSPPIGIMALWPFSYAFFESSLHLFPAVSRRIHQPELFWSQNLKALFWELVILGPLTAVVLWRAGRSRAAST